MTDRADHGAGSRSASEIARVAADTLDVPLLRLLKATLFEEGDPRVGTAVRIGDDALNAVGSLHAGAIATLLEVTAYLALLPDLGADEEAATHAFSACYMRAARTGEELRCRAVVTQRTKRLAFVAAHLTRGDDVIATASVTKSILRGHPR